MIKKRIFAYLIDYLVIGIYAVLLFFVSYTIHKILGRPIELQDPITGNLISLVTLTIPVFLYFFYFESSLRKGTIGKQIMKLKIQNNSKRNIFVRVLFKILPWEMAHFGIHWSVYYHTNALEVPLWVLVVMILPNIIILFYFITIFMSKGKSSIYDKIAKTRLEIYTT